MTTLDREDIWLFQNNGFIVAPGKLPENLLERVDAETDRQVAAQMEPISWAYDIGDPKKRIVNRLSKLLQRDRVYLEAATHPLVLDALEGILGPHIELLTNKHNMEMIKPGNAPPVEWHRGEPRSEPLVVTMVIALDDASAAKGCLLVIPGSHMNPFEANPYSIADNQELLNINFAESDLYRRSVPLPLKRGQVLLFNDAIMHGSDGNYTRHDRRSMTLAYSAHVRHNALKDDPEKILVRGERTYAGHVLPGPAWQWDISSFKSA